MSQPRFVVRQLFESIDKARTARGLSWAGLSREVGVSTSTIRRFETADDAEADGVLVLVRWLEQNPESFLSHGPPGREGTPSGMLLPDGAGIVRVDMELVANAAGDTGGARGRTRTTIQRLVAAAHRSGQPIAALTRLDA